LGIGDLVLRAFTGLLGTCAGLLRRERFDALFVTIYPAYPALLGPWLKRRFRVPFVLDYQDPWVGAWGETVGGGAGGRPDLKSRLSRALAMRLEPMALRASDAITAVSSATYELLHDRHPWVRETPCADIPLGGEPADFDALRRQLRSNPALLSERPLLAVYHEASSVVDVLRGTAASPTARVVTYGDADRAGARVEAIYDELAALVDNPRYDPGAVNWESLREWSAGALAG